MNKNEHRGRRERMRQRYMNEGMEHFEEHEVLEILLYYAISGRDTNELAHRFINEFGGLAEVFEAGPDELEKRMKVSRNTAILVSMIPQLSQKYMIARWGKKVLLDSVSKAGNFAVSLFAGKKNEEMYLICLNSANYVMGVKSVAKGTVNEAHIYPREIIEMIMQMKATGAILSHNHPGGSLEPSVSDKLTTERVKNVLDLIGVKLYDHVIVAGSKYLSMFENGDL